MNPSHLKYHSNKYKYAKMYYTIIREIIVLYILYMMSINMLPLTKLLAKLNENHTLNLFCVQFFCYKFCAALVNERDEKKDTMNMIIDDLQITLNHNQNSFLHSHFISLSIILLYFPLSIAIKKTLHFVLIIYRIQKCVMTVQLEFFSMCIVIVSHVSSPPRQQALSFIRFEC
jgi:hypothetical protein